MNVRAFRSERALARGGFAETKERARGRAIHRATSLMRASSMSEKTSASSTSSSTSTSTTTSVSPSPTTTTATTTAYHSNVVPFRARTRKRIVAPPGAPTIVILPGFGNAAEDYVSATATTAEGEGALTSDDDNNGVFSSILSFIASLSSDDDEEEQSKDSASSSLSSYFDSDDDSLPSEATKTTTATTQKKTSPPAPPPSLASSLESRGFRVAVVPVKRSHWLRVARCAFDPAYWRGEAEAETSYGWYLELAERAVVEEATMVSSSSPSSPSSSTSSTSSPSRNSVVLVGHSAGGWLGRALLGLSPAARKATAALVTLGTPHAPNPLRCVTGGALRKVNERWPGAFFESKSDGSDNDAEGDEKGENGEEEGEEEEEGEIVRYVAVAGNAVVGEAGAPRGTAQRSAAAAYSQVAGGDGAGVAGDGVVPLSAALALPGATHVVLDGVFHAPRSSSSSSRRRRASSSAEAEGVEEEEESSSTALPWFGDEGVVDSWLEALVEALE